MANNEHNPIAIRISQIQDLWIQNRTNHPDAKVYCLTCDQEDFPLVEGFIRLEGSPYGRSSDTILAFMTDYDSPAAFYSFLINEWISSFAAELEKHPDWNWTDFEELKQEAGILKQDNPKILKDFYIRMVSSFKIFEGVAGNILGITIIIYRIQDVESLNNSIKELAEALPPHVSLILTDYNGREVYGLLLENMKEKACRINIPDQNMSEAYKEIATQGDPHDPQVKYRCCLFALGEAANAGKKKEVKRLGEELIKICREIGGIGMWASAYLIYGGFMLGFKDEAAFTHKLLDKGIGIAQSAGQKETACIQILIQLYDYKGIAYNLSRDAQKAVGCFLKGAEIAREEDLKSMAVSQYGYALLVALKKDRFFYEPILTEAFEYGYALDDDELRTVNLSFIAHTYIGKIYSIEAEKREEIEKRMEALYGEDWQAGSKEIGAKLENEYLLIKK